MTDWWWGVDTSTWRIAVGARSSELATEHVCVDVDRKLRGGERLAAIRHAAGVAARMMCDRGCWPQAIQFEQPFAYGRNVEPVLYYAVGCAQAGMWSCMSGLCAPAGVRVEPLPVPLIDDVALSHVRKLAMGNGAAKKHEMMAWALGLDGVEVPLTQDEADAIVVAEGCRLEYPIGDGLVLREAPA